MVKGEGVIITHYSGIATRAAESIDGDAAHMKIILLKDDKSEEVLFIGKDFSQIEFVKKMKVQGRTPYEDNLR